MKPVLVSSGEYSDYHIHMTVEWLTDKTPSALTKEYLDEHPDERGDYHGSESGFANWLLEKGYARRIADAELHLGSYGTLKAEWLRDFEGTP